MRAAVGNDVDGIIGECGGAMMCATCHCYVDDAWAEAVGPQEDGESDLLDCAASETRPTSRGFDWRVGRQSGSYATFGPADGADGQAARQGLRPASEAALRRPATAAPCARG